MSSFLTGQKGSEKAAANSEARGTAKGPAGPFGNPGALRGSPETVCVPHKANALCYNTVSFLPERLIRAPVLKPRPRSQAGRSAAGICLIQLPAVSGRSVEAACMRPVGVRPVAPFLVRVRGTLICRGGIYAARQGCAPRGGCGKIDRFPYPVGRAFTPAEPIIFLIFICNMCGGRNRPPCKAKQTTYNPQTPNTRNVRGRHVCRPYTWTKRRRNQITVL